MFCSPMFCSDKSVVQWRSKKRITFSHSHFLPFTVSNPRNILLWPLKLISPFQSTATPKISLQWSFEEASFSLSSRKAYLSNLCNMVGNHEGFRLSSSKIFFLVQLRRIRVTVKLIMCGHPTVHRQGFTFDNVSACNNFFRVITRHLLQYMVHWICKIHQVSKTQRLISSNLFQTETKMSQELRIIDPPK